MAAASALERTLALAQEVPQPDLDRLKREVAMAAAEITHTKGLLGGLLGVEDQARQVLTEKQLEVESRRNLLQAELQRTQRLETLRKYQCLSLEPLKWRDDEGLPRLVLFSLDSPDFMIKVMPGNDGSISPLLPSRIAACYADVVTSLQAKRPPRKGLELTCRFQGLIPPEVRQRIKEAQPIFGRKIFIVAEPGPFTLNTVTPIPVGDPLIVGYDEAEPEHLWFIADFDTTPVEEAMIFHPPDEIES
jgi:hypothetical protein